MSQQEPPKIEFPCENYVIKVLGDAGDELLSHTLAVMDIHAEYDRTRVTTKASSKGTYQSVTVWITATGVTQLETIHQELRSKSIVKVVF